jgi:hypothetical protein
VGGEWWLGRNNRARNAGDLQRLARDIVVQLVNHVVQIDFDGHWRFSLAPSPHRGNAARVDGIVEIGRARWRPPTSVWDPLTVRSGDCTGVA